MTQAVLGHTIIWCATLLLTLTPLLINVWLDILTIPLITAIRLVQIYYEKNYYVLTLHFLQIINIYHLIIA